MDSLESKLLTLLHQVFQQINEAELSASLTGDNFNIFDILSLSTEEVRTHSALIAEFLNPSGSHGQGTLYLDLFLKQHGIAKDVFAPEQAKVKVEKNIGRIDKDYLTGGRIDILLTDINKHHIMIENKIYAGDQRNQMLRYHNFDRNAVLFYLTLLGSAPSEGSIGKQDFRFTCLAYRTHILEWLDSCYKNSTNLPNIREAISQYISLIRRLTGLTARNNIVDKVKKIIEDNPELLDSIIALGEAWISIVQETKTKFTNLKNQAICHEYITADSRYIIEVTTDEDVDGQYIGFCLRNVSNRERVGDDISAKYTEIFRALTESQQRNKWWNIGWYNPEPFARHQKFESLPSQQILSYYNDEMKMLNLVQQLKNQADTIVAELIKA